MPMTPGEWELWNPDRVGTKATDGGAFIAEFDNPADAQAATALKDFIEIAKSLVDFAKSEWMSASILTITAKATAALAKAGIEEKK